MNRVYQINIQQIDNGFIVQGAGKQLMAKDDAEVKSAVNQLAQEILAAPDKSEQVKTQTVTVVKPEKT